METWKDIPGYEGLYQVSDLGNVKSLEKKTVRKGHDVFLKEKILKPSENKRGVQSVSLYKENKKKDFRVHVLVALAFIGERPKGYHVCHINGVASDNNLSNLKYDTISENQIDIYRYGGKHGNGKLSIEQVLEIRKLYATGNYSQLKLGEMFTVDTKAIFNIINRKTFKWLNDDGTIDESKTSVKVS